MQGSRLAQARKDNSSTGDAFGSFLRSTISGLSGDWVHAEDVGLGDIPEATGIKQTIADVGGKVVGSALTIGAGQLAVEAGLTALAFTGPLAPIIAGTVAGLAYSALQNADLSTKLKDAAVTTILGGVAGAFKVRGIGQAVSRFEKGGKEAIELAQKQGGGIDDLIIKGGSEVIDELKQYGKANALNSKSLPTLLSKAVQDFQQDPANVGKLIPKTVENVIGKHVLDDKGLIRSDWLKNMENITPIVEQESRKILATQAFERGSQLADDWKNASMLGKTAMAVKKELADPGNLLASVPNGGKIFQAADDAVFTKNYLSSAAKIHFEPVYDKLSKMSKKNPEAYKDLSYRISQALEDRANAQKYLKTPFETDVYKSFEGAWDFWATNLEKRGIPVRENYFTHTQKILQDPKGVLGQQMPAEMSEGFFKERSGQLKDFVRDDIIKVYNNYDNFVSRKLAFDPVIEKWKELGQDATIGKFLTGVVTNRREPGGVIDWITGMRYKNLVAYNPFSAVSNLAQQGMARGWVSREAVQLAKKLRKIDDPEIVEFLNRSFSKYSESVIPKELMEGSKSAFDKLKFFETAEGRNWLISRSLGMSEELAQNKTFKSLVDGGMQAKDAMVKVLKGNKEVWERALTRGQDLASKTQFSMEQGFKPALFETVAEHPLLRIPLQFARFQASNMEGVINLFRPGGRELSILRRGFQDEANVVTRLQAMRTLAKGAKKLIGEVSTAEEKAILKGMVKELGEDMIFLKDEVKRIEPKTFLRSSQELGRMIVEGTAPKLARTWLKWGVVGYMMNKGVGGAKKASDIGYVLGGQIPGLEMVRGMDLNPRYSDPKYGLVANVVGTTPGVGLVDALIPGRPITREIYQTAFPKKEKKTKTKRRL